MKAAPSQAGLWRAGLSQAGFKALRPRLRAPRLHLQPEREAFPGLGERVQAPGS
jgi:hypothetical protein